MWGAFSGTHDLPRPKMWRRTDPERFQGGVGVSTDGGRTWTPSNAGMPESAITHVLARSRRARAGRAHALRDGLRPRRLQVDRRRPHLDAQERGPRRSGSRSPGASRARATATLYLVVARRSERGRIGDADDGALYRSTDGAEHWTRMTLPAGTNGPNGLAVDPADPRRLYLAAWGVATPGGDTGGGIFLSTDAGATLDERAAAVAARVRRHHRSARSRPSSTPPGSTRPPIARPIAARPGRASAGSTSSGAIASSPTSRTRRKVYVTTFGGSVWHGPATGDPAAVEDVVPRPGAPRAIAVEQLVEANIAGIHAYQVKLARKVGQGRSRLLVERAHGRGARRAGRASGRAARHRSPRRSRPGPKGEPSTFDPARDLEPLLARGLALSPTRCPSTSTRRTSPRPRPAGRAPTSARSPTSTRPCLEVERDGDRPPGPLPLLHRRSACPCTSASSACPARDADLLAVGQSARGEELRLARGHERRGVADRGPEDLELGREEPAHPRRPRASATSCWWSPTVAALVPKMRALPAQRVAVIGHSFTMDLHWSSPSAFVPIVTAMFARENPAVEFRQFQGGGLTSTRAYNRFFPDVAGLEAGRRAAGRAQPHGRGPRELRALSARR